MEDTLRRFFAFQPHNCEWCGLRFWWEIGYVDAQIVRWYAVCADCYHHKTGTYAGDYVGGKEQGWP